MQEYYDRLWKIPGKFGHWTKENVKYHMNFFAPWIMGSKLLDYGCGNGDFLWKIKKYCRVAHGKDISSEAIEQARKKYGLKMFFPTLEKEYETVVCFDVLEHILDIDATLDDIHGLLTRGGYLLITTTELTTLKTILIALFALDKFFEPTQPHIRFFTKCTLKCILEKHGFEVIKYQANRKYFGIIPKGQMVVARRK